MLMWWGLGAAQMWCGNTTSLLKRKRNIGNLCFICTILCSVRRMPCNPQAWCVRLIGSNPAVEEHKCENMRARQASTPQVLYTTYSDSGTGIAWCVCPQHGICLIHGRQQSQWCFPTSVRFLSLWQEFVQTQCSFVSIGNSAILKRRWQLVCLYC